MGLLERIRAVPFVIPVYHTDGQFFRGDDGCPLPRSERTPGHNAATIGVALEIAATCNQLAYGPELAARSLVHHGELAAVDSAQFRQEGNLFLHVNAERALMPRLMLPATDATTFI